MCRFCISFCEMPNEHTYRLMLNNYHRPWAPNNTRGVTSVLQSFFSLQEADTTFRRLLELFYARRIRDSILLRNDIRAGFIQGDGIVDINKNDCSIPSTMLEILKGGCICSVDRLKAAKPTTVPREVVTLVAPITGMDKILAVGLNYADYCKAQDKEPPKEPMVFSKFASCIIGPNEPVRIRTAITKEVDWEVELVVVIGSTCTNVKSANAYANIFGYTIAQDITSRDWLQSNGGQFLLAKNQDTFCPIGPCIVTTDEIADPHNLNISCSVNGALKQKSNTSQLIHKIPAIIERISKVMTLLPGDILLTGTPAGVGQTQDPPEYLKPGDVVHSVIQNIGCFEIKIEDFDKK